LMQPRASQRGASSGSSHPPSGQSTRTWTSTGWWLRGQH
jgi:hypothetical protein